MEKILGCYFVCLLLWLVGSMLYEHCVKSVQNTLEEPNENEH